MRNHAGTEDGPRVSKYARKLAARAQGVIPDFEFKNSRRPDEEERKPESSAGISAPETQVMDLVVTRVFVGKGVVFLQTSAGKSVLMNHKLFCKDTKLSTIDEGWSVKAKVQENPNGKGLRVVRVLSSTPRTTS